MARIDVRDFAPMLARGVRDPSEIPDGWALEEKWDGVRIVASFVDGTLRLATRSGRDYARRVHELATLGDHIDAGSWILDGELVSMGPGERADYRAVMASLQTPDREVPDHRLRFVAFDLLAVDGTDLRPEPWRIRRARLDAIAATDGTLCVPTPEYGSAATYLAEQAGRQCEGLVAKDPDAGYHSGARPGQTWLKFVRRRHAEFIVTDWTALQAGGAADPSRIGALRIAARLAGGTLRDAGKVGSGFDAATRRLLATRLAGDDAPLVVDVGFAGWTDEGRLRHPSFRAVRDDIDAHTLITEID
ncbi:MAG: ATP-dependent ligase [Thermoleophilia bacterium]|nr:ATP-dependent ligase [Thermoleophilia bacterium]